MCECMCLTRLLPLGWPRNGLLGICESAGETEGLGCQIQPAFNFSVGGRQEGRPRDWWGRSALIFSALKGFSDKRRVSVGLVFASPELTVHVVLFRITIDFSGGNRKFRWR